MKTKVSGRIVQFLFRIMGIIILIQGVRMIGEGVYANGTSSLSNLVIFLVFGALLTVIGFFMSGAWA